MSKWLLLVSMFAVGGCSTANSWIHRPTNYEQIPQDYAKEKTAEFEPDVAAVSVDASRRLVMSQLTPISSLPTSAKRVTCSEPPPDAALGILAKSALDLSKTVAGGNATTAKFSDEFATTVTALAKRSANVEIWRTTSSTYCTLLMNGWNTQAERYLATAHQFVEKTAQEEKDKPKEPTTAELLSGAYLRLDAASAAVIEADRVKAVNSELLAQAKLLGDAKKIAAAQAALGQANLRVIEVAGEKQRAQLDVDIAKRAVEAKRPAA